VASTIAWLDQDEHQRRTMLQVIEAFGERDTVDELGLGGVRDAISETLFPGMSVLHTRARYLLFIPWIYAGVARDGHTGDRALGRGRQRELQLIDALLAGHETDGVIGLRAVSRLKRLPSAAYWAVLGRYRIRTMDTSIDCYCRALGRIRASRHEHPHPDDPDLLTEPATAGWHRLPQEPYGLLERATFRLTPNEAAYLLERLTGAVPGSLLAWLLARPRQQGRWAARVWEERLPGLPADLTQAIDHGRRLSQVMYGAAVLYNLQLAEAAKATQLADDYRGLLEAWADELSSGGACVGWDRPGLWRLVHGRNPRISLPTSSFVERWAELASRHAGGIADHGTARQLIGDRERQLKGPRARLANPRALDQWRGASGLRRMDFRWGIGTRIVTDIHDGLDGGA